MKSAAPLKHHALLFTGGNFDIKLAEAKRMAAELLGADNFHPDRFIVEPHEKNHSIKIDQIRALSAKLQQKPQHANLQVAIIVPAEAMTTSAANALLKTLEEPAGDVLLILISDQPQRLLPTIRSRCQLKRFPFIDSEKENAEFQVTYNDIYKKLSDLRRRNIDAITVASELAKSESKITLNALYRAVGEILKKQDAEKQRKLFHYLDEVLAAKRRIDSNIALNAQLLFENLLLQWSEL